MPDILTLHGIDLLRSRLAYVPSLPGVYIMRDVSGTVIYVGKAKNLRRRLRDYLSAGDQDPKVSALVAEMKDFEVHGVKSENDALLLEERLITDFMPKYNLAQRQGKRRFWICVNAAGSLPKLDIVHARSDCRSQRYGPYPSYAVALWLVRFLNQLYGLRSCVPDAPRLEHFNHCLEHVTNRCCAPCVGRISASDYCELVERARGWLSQPRWKIGGILKEHMRRLAKERRYEQAALCRDVVQALGSSTARLPPRGLRVSRELAEMQMKDLARELNLPHLPVAMEAFDISHFGGSGNVASMVRFVDGLPNKKCYRYFRLKVKGVNDVECMTEAVMRRYRDVPLPDLVVIDGGLPQLGAALSAFCLLGVKDPLVVALAKERETIYLRDGTPLQLCLSQPALHLVQRIRDEAHRTSNGYTKRAASRRMVVTAIERIPGVGPNLAKRLISLFGSPERVRQASVAQLVRVKGVGRLLANKIRSST